MKRFLILLFLSLFAFSGCTFLSSSKEESEDSYEDEDYSYEEEAEEEEVLAEETQDEGDGEYMEEDGDYEVVEEDGEEAEEALEEEGEKKGFFSSIFGSKGEEAEDYEVEEEGEEEEMAEESSYEEEGEEMEEEMAEAEEEEGDSEFIGEPTDMAEEDRNFEDYEEVDEEEEIAEESSYEEEGEEEEIAEAEVEEEVEESSTTIAEAAGLDTSTEEEEIAEESSTAPTATTESAGLTQQEPEEPSSMSDLAATRQSLNKILPQAYKKSGTLINAVYIARPGDSLSSIAQKIYGSNEEQSLKKINSHLGERQLVVGDKIYYNSPNRPQDSSRILYYFEDIGAQASNYELRPGDNIRSIAYKLLGHEKSWKEIWATNPDLVSKGEITTARNISYWPKDQQMLAKAPKIEKAQAAPTPAPTQETTPEPAPQEPTLEEPAPIEEPVPQEVALDNMEPAPATEAQDSSFTEPSDPEIEANQEDLMASADESYSAQSSPLSNPLNKKPGFAQSILEDKTMIFSIAGVLVFFILLVRIISKRRKGGEFDYAEFDVDA